LLATEQVDFVSGLQEVDFALPTRVHAEPRWEQPVLLVLASEPIKEWQPVEVVELARDDPWRAIYVAVLGSWPISPDPQMLDRYLMRTDLRFEEIVPVDRVAATGSLEDLMARTGDRERLTPRSAANMFASGLRPDTSFLGGGAEVLPNPRAVRRAAGPNIIVAVTPGSVEDIALIWNLRGAHGGSRVLPIGVPTDAITPQALRDLQEPGRATMFGLGGGTCYLVSASVALDELERLAAQSPSVQAVPYEALLTFGPAAGRVRSHVALWQEGKTRLDPMSEGDREVLRVLRRQRGLSLTLDVAVDGFLLPTDPTMRGTEMYGRFQAGVAQVSVSDLRHEQTVPVQWPSSWTCLAAVARSRGLNVAASDPGRAAATLIRALGGVDEVRLLRHRPLINLMYRMAERSGMSWWKKKWKDAHNGLLAAGADATALERTETLLGRDDPAVAPPGEGRAVLFQEFVTALGSESAARNWIAWAERRHLLVRGADVTCPDCKTETWLPLAALPPPVPCPGCGRQILHPYSPRELKFTYRLGEAIRRVLETDSLGHVLALHWFALLFDRGGLVGAYPGVCFTDESDSGRTVGEADVVLLFADGSLVPVEMKRRLAGADERTTQLMDALAIALAAPWDVFAVTEPARDIPSLVSLERQLPARPRVLLTDDQLLADFVVWAWGDNPFKWSPFTAEQDRERERSYTKRLSANDPDVPWDRVADTLLNSELGVARHKPGATPGSRGSAHTAQAETSEDATWRGNT
jgi:hypothetical protein